MRPLEFYNFNFNCNVKPLKTRRCYARFKYIYTKIRLYVHYDVDFGFTTLNKAHAYGVLIKTDAPMKWLSSDK